MQPGVRLYTFVIFFAGTIYIQIAMYEKHKATYYTRQHSIANNWENIQILHPMDQH